MSDHPSGFLVVEVPHDLERFRHRPTPYEGVDRVPAFPGRTAEETNALDAYVLGDVKDQTTNLIPSLEVAEALAARLAGLGERRYEVILCCAGPHAEPIESINQQRVERLGFDVAAIEADYWSIVDDFSRSAWARKFRSLLNENGLFDRERDAVAYLREYKHRREVDGDSPLRVVFVARVCPSTE